MIYFCICWVFFGAFYSGMTDCGIERNFNLIRFITESIFWPFFLIFKK